MPQYCAVQDPTGWDAVVHRLDPGDLYGTYGYNVASSQLEIAGTMPVMLDTVTDSGEAALPLLLRPLQHGLGYDATSAYGYGGQLFEARSIRK